MKKRGREREREGGREFDIGKKKPGDAVPCFLTSHSGCDVWNVKKYGAAPGRASSSLDGEEKEKREGKKRTDRCVQLAVT